MMIEISRSLAERIGIEKLEQFGLDKRQWYSIESNLLKTFGRAKRWNAIMLLDESDVYVHERGNDLEQNAIVGVFLRVLEYQASMLFLTTNRPDDVDDAIASRCIAKLVYKTPTLDKQARIWRVLADGAGISMPDVEIKKVVQAHPKLKGRDIKNLLKLSRIMAGKAGSAVTAAIVEQVTQFKPT